MKQYKCKKCGSINIVMASVNPDYVEWIQTPWGKQIRMILGERKMGLVKCYECNNVNPDTFTER